MIINMTGGGAGLNLKVVGGTTQPTNPKENTVWVNTDTEITGYAFSATEPTNPVEGMVWIITGTTPEAAMNVDKKNTVMIYPLNCKQYVSGALVEKTAKTYQGGTWVEWWDGTLFNNGNEYTAITGGFSAVGNYQTAENVDGYLHLLADYGKFAAYLTENAIDLTDFSKLTGIVRGTSSTEKQFGIASAREAKMAAYTVFTTITSDTTVTLDISGYNGLYYVGFITGYNNNGYVKHIKLER